MAAGVKIIGGGKLQAKLKKWGRQKKARLTAGFYKGAKYEDGTPVAQVAWWNNFGTIKNGGFTPPRPFFSDTINQNKDKWAENYGKALKKTDYDMERSAKLVGEQMRADIQKQINKGNYDQNAPSTIEASGNPNKKPLKDTFLMMRSVGYQYNDESPQYRQSGH